MKKFFIINLVLLMGTFLCFPATFNLTSPTGGTFNTGTTMTISWTSTGMSGHVIIQLRTPGQAGGPMIKYNQPVGNSTYLWTIPHDTTTGLHFIRIKQGSNTLANSANFTISPGLSGGNQQGTGTVQQPGGQVRKPTASDYKKRLKPDLAVSWIGKTDNHFATFKLKNKGMKTYNGPVLFDTYVEGNLFGRDSTNVNLGASGEVQLTTPFSFMNLPINYLDDRLDVKVLVDPTNQIKESNETNNSKEVSLNNTFQVVAVGLEQTQYHHSGGDHNIKYMIKFTIVKRSGTIRYQILSDVPRVQKPTNGITISCFNNCGGFFNREILVVWRPAQDGPGPHWIKVKAWTDKMPQKTVTSNTRTVQ